MKRATLRTFNKLLEACMDFLFPPPPQPTAPRPTAHQHMTGVVTRFVHQKADTGWGVANFETLQANVPPDVAATLLVNDDDEVEVMIVGVLTGVKPGERLKVEGTWVEHDRFGHQFKVSAWAWDDTDVPDAEGMALYLGSGLFRHIGPVRAEKIVARWGKETYNVMDSNPDALLSISGITPLRLAEIREDWLQHRGGRITLAFLQKCGLSPVLASKVLAEWGIEAQRRVEENPYSLTKLKGVGFKTADDVARKMGLPVADPRRIRAGLLFALETAEDAGHCCLPPALLIKTAGNLLNGPEALEEAISAAQLQAGLLALQSGGEAEVIMEFGACYVKAMRDREAGVAQLVNALLEAPSAITWANEVTPEAIAQLVAESGETLTATQTAAVFAAIRSKISILTGGPGTGKTFTLKTLVKLLKSKGARFALAAPTGRAAKRIAESTGETASTIHRLLGYEGGGFVVDSLLVDFIIIDESSMLDLWLTHFLLKALPTTTHLLFVGDADQLPSVGAGYVLGDLIESGRVPVTRLDFIFRQGQTSLIVSNAHAINQGQMPDLSNAATGDCFMFEQPNEALAAFVADLVQRRIPSGKNPIPAAQIQVLSPIKRGPCGVFALNAALQQALNPPAPDKAEVRAEGGKVFRVGDPLLVMRNDYGREVEVFNGDIGRLTAITPEDDDNPARLTVFFEGYGSEVTWTARELDTLSLAYCVTIHKSQGSEYPCVIAVMSQAHHTMLERQILYTALTRAKRLCVIVGTKKAVAIAVSNAKGKQRHTHLSDRLKGTGTHGN